MGAWFHSCNHTVGKCLLCGLTKAFTYMAKKRDIGRYNSHSACGACYLEHALSMGSGVMPNLQIWPIKIEFGSNFE